MPAFRGKADMGSASQSVRMAQNGHQPSQAYDRMVQLNLN
jgi:hypothetical protein